MEMTLVNKNTIPVKPDWGNKLKEKLSLLQNGKAAIKIVFTNGEKTDGLETAWRKLCAKEIKKPAHVKISIKKNETTVWLWTDS